MDVVLKLSLAVVAIGLFCAWCYALWRGWRHASRDQTQAERRFAMSALVLLLLVPIALAVVGVSGGTAKVVIAMAVAAVLPVFISVGVRDHRRRERRIAVRRRGTADGDE